MVTHCFKVRILIVTQWRQDLPSSCILGVVVPHILVLFLGPLAIDTLHKNTFLSISDILAATVNGFL